MKIGSSAAALGARDQPAIILVLLLWAFLGVRTTVATDGPRAGLDPRTGRSQRHPVAGDGTVRRPRGPRLGPGVGPGHRHCGRG